MFWFFGCQVPCSPNTQDLVARVRATRTSISYQRIHRPYLGIFSEICLFSMLLSLFNFKMYYTYLILEIVFKVLYCFVVLSVGRKVLDQLFCMVYKYSVLFYTAPQWELAFL